MNVPPHFANLAWAGANWLSYRQFSSALRRPRETQIDLLLHSLRRDENSDYGRAHQFAKIRCYQEFKERVPLADYEEVNPAISRIQAGEKNILCSSPVSRLIPTSGSSGARKLIPFTNDLQVGFNQAIGPWIFDLYRSYPRLISGPAYWSITPMAAAKQESEPRSVVPIGFDHDAEYLGLAEQWLAKSIMVAPPALSTICDLAEFRYATLLCLLRHGNLRLISIWHPSFLTLLLGELPKLWEQLLSALFSVPQTRRRANQLRALDPGEACKIWPDLTLISCWGDAMAEGGARELAELFPESLIQPKGLLATEGCISIPFQDRHPLAIRSHFFEFIDGAGVTRMAHEIQEGHEYEVVLSNGAGLWRYRLHDRVCVDGFAYQTPSIRFLGKSNNVSDLFGEKLSETFVAAALRQIFGRDAFPAFAMLAPEGDNSGWRYSLFLEGHVDTSLSARLDLALQANPHYACCRNLGQLLPPGVRLITDGYQQYVNAEIVRGRKLGEIKPVALSNRTDWLSRFLKVA